MNPALDARLKAAMDPIPLSPAGRAAHSLWHPIPYRPVVSCRDIQPNPRPSGAIPMNAVYPFEHGRLVGWEPMVPEPPGMDPHLLPVEIPHLEDAMSGKERVSVVASLSTCNQASKPLLQSQQCSPPETHSHPLRSPPTP